MTGLMLVLSNFIFLYRILQQVWSSEKTQASTTGHLAEFSKYGKITCGVVTVGYSSTEVLGNNSTGGLYTVLHTKTLVICTIFTKCNLQ